MKESLFLWARFRLIVRIDHLLVTVSKLRLFVKVLHVSKRMGLGIEGREMKLMSFLASLESISTKGNSLLMKWVGIRRRGEDHCLMGTCIKVISWNVRGLNCLIKRGDVKWVLRRFAGDIG